MTARVLVAADYLQEWRGRGWADGLRAAGVDVIEHDWSKDYSPGVVGYLEQRVLVGPGIARINRHVLSRAAETKPDVVLVYAGRPIAASTVRELARVCPVAAYENDDPFGRWGRQPYFRYFRAALPDYTCHHVFREINIREYQERGCKRVRLLRSFYLPWLHRPMPAADDDHRKNGAGVVFVGNGQPGSRIQHIVALVRAGIAVRIHGDPRYWRRYLPPAVFQKLSPIRPARGAEYAKLLSDGAICLAFFSDGNRDNYSVRTFEIPACGGFMLAQRTAVMQRLFEEGQEAEYFSTSGELAAKVRHYLARDEDRRRIAEAGHRRCLADRHDVVSRMRQWLADLGEWGLIAT